MPVYAEPGEGDVGRGDAELEGWLVFMWWIGDGRTRGMRAYLFATLSETLNNRAAQLEWEGGRFNCWRPGDGIAGSIGRPFLLFVFRMVLN